MGLRTGNGHYIKGGAWGCCDRCGFTYRLADLKTEWTGLRVCPDDYDPRPSDMSPPNIYPEGVPLPGARPDPGDVLGANTTTAADL